ncbi:Card1-like endonuclease domain-containing protein [Clostridium perfringens]|uniref:Card1-like endonuclease domain-containing protein n=1 Tax=Clostridium perfringens TaxID=1502 RepID=UPI003B00DE6F
MNYDFIITILDEHNESSILLAEKLKPKEIIYLYKKDKELKVLNSLRQFYLNKFPNCNFSDEKLGKDTISSIEEIIKRMKSKNTAICLNQGNKKDILIMYTLALKHNIDGFFLDIPKEELLKLNLESVQCEKCNFVDLDVEDIIDSIGASIVVDSTEISEINIIETMTNYIASNLDLWKKYKIRLSDNSVFIHDESNPRSIKIDKELLSREEVMLLDKILNFLEKNGQIKVKELEQCLKVTFQNEFIKGFIFKSGTWLEVLTKNIIEEIKSIDDIKSGLLFLWNDKESRVKNELDVVAIKDSVLICVSCKDSKKYDEVALNELNVYSEQLGGENVIKILVATHPPIKSSISKRAKEMGINLVVFDGNKKSFKEELEKIIK